MLYLAISKQSEKIKTCMGHFFLIKNHVDSIVSKCGKVINVMRSLSGGLWGAGQDTPMMSYRAMVRSRMDYGCLCYGTAAKTILKRLSSAGKGPESCLWGLPFHPNRSLTCGNGGDPIGYQKV